MLKYRLLRAIPQNILIHETQVEVQETAFQISTPGDTSIVYLDNFFF